MALRRPRPTFDAAATQIDGSLNLELQQALINQESRTQVLERAVGIGGLSSDQRSKIAPVPPRADVAVSAVAGSGRMTVSLTNPEFIRGRGNPLRTPIYHRVSYSPDQTFRTGVVRLPPSFQTHWPVDVPSGARLRVEVESSYDGINWNLPIVATVKA